MERSRPSTSLHRVKLLAAAAPGVLALVLATIALVGNTEEAPERLDVSTVAGSGSPSGPASRSLTLAELYDRVDGVVARVDARRTAEDPPFGNGRRIATGSAFLVDDEGHLVTNAHVVDKARKATVRFGRSSKRIPAKIVGRDRSTDLAVLKIAPGRVGDEKPLELAPRGSITVGEPVLAVGTPYRLQSSASAGIVSATGRQIRGLIGLTVPDAIQTDAAVNPGNSGGPLVDAEGRVVGVNTQGRAPGVSFAVSADTVRRIVPQLVEDGRARSAFLGVSLDEDGEVTDVRDGGPADDAGIRAGDVIRKIDGRDTTAEGAVASAVAAHRPGEEVEVELERRTVTVTLAAQPR